jgi:hypothetical protein
MYPDDVPPDMAHLACIPSVPHHCDPGEALCNILMRMTSDHWQALEYVKKTGSQPIQDEVGYVEDLLAWGCVTRSPGWKMNVTALGQRVMDEEQP